MYLVERHIIDFGHSLHGEVDKLCFLSKNLYNKANYIVRREFIGTSKEREKGLVDHANWIRSKKANSICSLLYSTFLKNFKLK